MKLIHIIAAIAICLSLGACMTTTTETTFPDGRKVTTTIKGADTAAIVAGTAAAQVIAPLVRPEK